MSRKRMSDDEFEVFLNTKHPADMHKNAWFHFQQEAKRARKSEAELLDALGNVLDIDQAHLKLRRSVVAEARAAIGKATGVKP